MTEKRFQRQKQFLRQIGAADRETEILIDTLERSKSQLTSAKAATLSDMPKGGQPRDMGDAVIAFDNLRQKVNEIIASLCALKMDAIDVIYSIEDSLLREVLEHRYIQFMEWDEVRDAMGYKEVKTVYNLHGKALKKIAEKIH